MQFGKTRKCLFSLDTVSENLEKKLIFDETTSAFQDEGQEMKKHILNPLVLLISITYSNLLRVEPKYIYIYCNNQFRLSIHNRLSISPVVYQIRQFC